MKKIQKLLLGLFVFGVCFFVINHSTKITSNAVGDFVDGYTFTHIRAVSGSGWHGVRIRVAGTTYSYDITYKIANYQYPVNFGDVKADGGTHYYSYEIDFDYKEAARVGDASYNVEKNRPNAITAADHYLVNTVYNDTVTVNKVGEITFDMDLVCTYFNSAKYESLQYKLEGLMTGKINGTDYKTSTGNTRWTNSYDIAASAKDDLLEGTKLDKAHIKTDYYRKQETYDVYAHAGIKVTGSSWKLQASDVTEDTISCSNTTGVPGNYTVTVTYAGLSESCNMYWYKKDLSSITASYGGPNIVEGLTFKPEDVTITVNYNNNTSDTIKGNISGVSFSTTTVASVGSNTIDVYYEYTGNTYQKKKASITVTGLEKDLVSITADYIGDDIVEEMLIPADKVKIVATFNNNTEDTYYANSPKQSPHNSNQSYAWINNGSGTTVYSTKDGTNNFYTTRWSVNNGSMTFTVYNEYYGTKSTTASDTITVKVLKKTPVSVEATYPEEIEVVEGLPFDKANVTIAVTYDNGTVYTIDANGLEKSGYTNGYELDIKNTFLSSTDYDDYIGDEESVGESWDIIVYNVGENRFVVYFTENGKQVIDDFVVIGIEKTAISIEATYHGPDITMGLAYLPGNVEIIVTYDNYTIGTLKGTAKSVTLTNAEGVETTTVPNLGVNTYTAQFQECTDDFEVIGKEAVLTSIYVLQKPRRMFYTVEDAFDPTDMIVMATFSDYSEEMVQNSALDLSDGDSLRAGQEYVMIGYTVGGIRKETQTDVYVDIGSLSHITIEQEPNKLEYDPGEDFDPTGMVVLAHYSTGKSRVLGRTEYELIGAENLQSGQTSVTVRYTEDGIPVDEEQYITVRPKMLIDIEILKNPNKLNYFPGQNFSPAGMTVMAIYSDDSKRAVTDSCTILDGTSLPLGKKTVTVSYTEVVGDNPITIMKTIDIVVADATVNNISAIYMGGKIKSGEAFSPSDVMITINYTNGEKQTVDGNYDGISFSTLIVKTVNNTVTVSYRGHTCVIKIPILNDENNENQSITEIVSKSNWKEFFTVKKTRAVEDYYYSSGYKIPYIRKGIQTQKPLTMDIQFKLYAIEMGGWTTWYNSGEIVSTGNAPATGIKVGLLNAPDVTLSATINGKKYNNVDSSQEFLNPQTVSFELNGSDYFKLQYKASYNGKSTGWVDEGTVIGIPDISIDGISFRIVKKK